MHRCRRKYSEKGDDTLKDTILKLLIATFDCDFVCDYFDYCVCVCVFWDICFSFIFT